MPRPISNKNRTDIVRRIVRGESKIDIAKRYCVCVRTIARIWNRFSKTGCSDYKVANRGRKPLVPESQMSLVKERLSQKPYITLANIIEKFGLPITESGLSRRLSRSGFKLKKRVPPKKPKNINGRRKKK